jgi:NADH-quinone oxidoreductase subunit M
MLAGVLLKMGGYAMFYMLIPMFPELSFAHADMVFILSIIAVIYASFMAFAQQNIKKTIAYSSVAHMGFVTAGLFSVNAAGLCGALLQMLSHGVVSAGLFAAVGILYERTHSKEMTAYGGVAKDMPCFAVLTMVLTLASIALPGTSGFAAELPVLIGVGQRSYPVMSALATGMVLGAVYMLWLYRAVFFGSRGIVADNGAAQTPFRKLTLPEGVTLFALSATVLLLGIFSPMITEPWLDYFMN